MFLLCLNCVMSTSLPFLASVAMLWRTSFRSSLILSSLMRYSFSFSFRISSFFSSSSFFCSNYRSIARIFSCHSFSFSRRSCSSVQISSSMLRIISGVMVGSGFLAFRRSFPALTFCSSSRSFSCLTMNCSWFLRSTFSASMILSLMALPSSLSLLSSFLRSSIFSWKSWWSLRFLRCLFCSFLILRRLSFSSSSCLSSCLRARSCCSLEMRLRLLQIFSSWRLTAQILLFISVISSCCLRSSPFFSRSRLSSSLGVIGPYRRFRPLSFSRISYNCCDSSKICSFSLMFCSIIRSFQDCSPSGYCSQGSGGSVRCSGDGFWRQRELGADLSSGLSPLFSRSQTLRIVQLLSGRKSHPHSPLGFGLNCTNQQFFTERTPLDQSQIITSHLKGLPSLTVIQRLPNSSFPQLSTWVGWRWVRQTDAGKGPGILLCAIMFNKFNQKGGAASSRVVASRSLKAKSKLTVFMVYKMIERRKEMESQTPSAPIVFDQLVTDNLLSRDSFPDHFNLKRQREKLRSEEAVRSAVYEKRTRCHTELEASIVDSVSIKRQAYVMTTKNANSEQASDINRLIIEKLRKVVVNDERSKKKDKQIKIEDFGLNITQIKRLDMPLKRQIIKGAISSNKTNLLQGNSRKNMYAPCTNNKRLHAKRSMLKQKQQNKETISNLQQKEFIQSMKFQSLDSCYVNKNISAKRIGKESSNYTQKLQKMFDCLDIILNSYHCCLDPARSSEREEAAPSEADPKAKSRVLNNKYYYFVGSGNNGNLIRSILRKRSWWTETTTLLKANFVWSQLKIPEVIDRVQNYEDNWSSDFLPFEEDKEETEPSSLMRSSGKKSSTTMNTDVPKLKDACLAQIFHEKQDKRYYLPLAPRKSAMRLESIETPELVHNHYEQNFMFGNKNALYYNISMYYDFLKKDLAKIVPLTYYLEKNSPKSLAEFEKVFSDSKKKGMIWILKPAENSNRGQGIVVSSSLTEIKASLNLHKKLIVQSYVKNLLLYNGRKFDIRTYMLAATVHGRLKVFWYDEGYIRTSSQPYDLTNLFDSYIHLTNDAIQKTGENYGKYEDGNKLSYSEFERYLEARFPNRENAHINVMHEQMKELAREAVRAIYCRIDKSKKEHCFELFGLDFIIDSNFKPSLIEINTNPCLELSSSILERLIPRMMENAFRLCIDPVFRPKIECACSKSQSYYIYDETFLERNKFTLIFDEKYDRDFEWEQKCKKMRGIEWGEGQQEEYENEGSLIVVDY